MINCFASWCSDCRQEQRDGRVGSELFGTARAAELPSAVDRLRATGR